jgi:hypothetical protein
MKRVLIVFLLVPLIFSACDCANTCAQRNAPADRHCHAHSQAYHHPHRHAHAHPHPAAGPGRGLTGVPDPRVTNPELFDLARPDAPIPQFVNAMRMAGIEVTGEQVLEGLQFEHRQYLVRDENGNVIEGRMKEYVFAVWKLPEEILPEDYRSLRVKLLFGFNLESKSWTAISTRDLAELTGLLFGGMIENHDDPLLSALITESFNFVTITSAALQSPIGAPVNYDHEDYQLKYAQSLGFFDSIMIGPVVGGYPEGFQRLGRGEAREWFTGFVSSFMERYKGKIKYYILVNEPHADLRTVEDKITDYIDLTYRIARETNPEAFLIFSQTAAHDKRLGDFVRTTAQIGNTLFENGLIDAIGVQGHIFEGGVRLAPTREQVREAFAEYKAPIFITELDTDLHGIQNEKMLKQALWYQILVDGCLETKRCAGINLWGTFPDRRSWYETVRGQPDADPTPWDDDYHKKIAYYAILSSLYDYGNRQ